MNKFILFLVCLVVLTTAQMEDLWNWGDCALHCSQLVMEDL